MIIGRDLLSELWLDLRFSDYTISGNGGVYEGFTVYMEYPSDLRDDAILRDEQLWESEHVIDATRRL